MPKSVKYRKPQPSRVTGKQRDDSRHTNFDRAIADWQPDLVEIQRNDDCKLLLAAFCAGIATWAPYSIKPNGNIVLTQRKATSYYTIKVGLDGLPIMTEQLRSELRRVLGKGAAS